MRAGGPYKVEVSYVGYQSVVYKSINLQLGENYVLDANLKESTELLDEVVITGYQVIDRKKLTSAITSVKAEDIMIPGVNSIDQMLEGRIPDLMLTTNSGGAAFEDSGNFDLGWQSRTVVGCQWRSGERSGAFGFGCAQRPRLCKSHRKCDCRIKPSGYPTDRCIERRCCNCRIWSACR